MKNLKHLNCTTLTKLQARETNGGASQPSVSLWKDLAHIGGMIANGLGSLFS